MADRGFRDHATFYTSLGWKVFPLQEGSKVPYPGSRGVLDATDDRDTIDAWHEACAESNIAIATGASGLLVVDLDPRNHCWQTLRLWEKQGHILPMTVHARTRSGGLHLYFSHPTLPDGWRRRLPGGVDIQTGAKYVIAPPSVIFPEKVEDGIGGRYEWTRQPLGADLRAPPSWLLTMLKPPSAVRRGVANRISALTGPGVDRAIAGSLRKVARAGKGNRNNELNRQAHLFGKMVAEGKIDEAKAEELLLRVAMDVNPDIGLTANRATIRSGIRGGKAHHLGLKLVHRGG